MINRSVLECIEVLMRSMRAPNIEKGFGNSLFIGTGDFRQVAPVIKGGSKTEIIDASVKHSWVWQWFETVSLEQPMRFGADIAFSMWLDAVGDDSVPLIEEADPAERKIDVSQFRIFDNMDVAIESIFPPGIIEQPDLCMRRAILSPVNIVVDKYNDAVLERLHGNEVVLYGLNWLQEDVDKPNELEQQAVIEYLSLAGEPGVPPQELKLKVGSVCALMRNLSPEQGLVKNVRVTVQLISRHSIIVRKISNGMVGEKEYALPRINFAFTPRWANYTVVRRQFPLRLAYATTFNSCQGLTLDKVALDLSIQPFAHGQLYTALSRVRCKEDLSIIVEVDESIVSVDKIGASNVMWIELLNG